MEAAAHAMVLVDDGLKLARRPRAKRTSVCVIGLRGIPDVMGGVETHCENLYPMLDEMAGDRLSITILARNRYVASSREYRGVKVVPIYAPTHKFFEAIIHSAWAVMWARFKLRADVVHIHAIGPSLVARLARVLGMKVVVTHHGEDYNRAKWNPLAKFMLKLGEQIGVTRADRVISISRTVSDMIKVRYPEQASRIVYIPNGVSLDVKDEDDAALLSRLGVEPGRYVLAVGRLVPEKGFQDLIEAFEGSQAAKDGMKLVIVGDDDHADAFAKDLVAKRSDSVIFAGRQPRAKVLYMYRNASLFVLPSYHEGLPFVALEAIASGAPTLLSDIGGNRELDLPEPNYFPAGDVAALRGKLDQGHAALRVDEKIVLEHYDWPSIAKQTVQVYDSLSRK